MDYIEEYKKNHQHLLDIQEMKNLEFESMQLNNFNKTRAFVKIQDGCNNYCSYCVIPYTRGRIRSRDIDEIEEEVTKLVSKGFKEVVLTGIHLTSYGVDNNKGSLLEVIQEIMVPNLNIINLVIY